MKTAFIIMLIGFAATAKTNAAYVLPQMGGGSPGQTTVAMKHADIFLIGQQVFVNLDNSISTPVLLELTDPDEFDPNEPWSVITDKAYNFQFGWNPGGFISLPSASAIWIEQTNASTELEVFDRTPLTLGYEPILGTFTSDTKWRWSGSMTHNVYAVQSPTDEEYFAEYLVYVGDFDTGEPLTSYQPATVRFDFLFDLPLQGDYDGDGNVTPSDYQVWFNQFGQSGGSLTADGNQDGIVDAADFTLWRDNYGTEQSSLAMAIPEPSTSLMLSVFCMLFGVLTLRRQTGNIRS